MSPLYYNINNEGKARIFSSRWHRPVKYLGYWQKKRRKGKSRYKLDHTKKLLLYDRLSDISLIVETNYIGWKENQVWKPRVKPRLPNHLKWVKRWPNLWFQRKIIAWAVNAWAKIIYNETGRIEIKVIAWEIF